MVHGIDVNLDSEEARAARETAFACYRPGGVAAKLDRAALEDIGRKIAYDLYAYTVIAGAAITVLGQEMDLHRNPGDRRHRRGDSRPRT